MRLAAPDLAELRRRLADAERRARGHARDRGRRQRRAGGPRGVRRRARGEQAPRRCAPPGTATLAPRCPGSSATSSTHSSDSRRHGSAAASETSRPPRSPGSPIRPAGWEEAETRHRRWQALADASQAHARRRRSLAELDFDPRARRRAECNRAAAANGARHARGARRRGRAERTSASARRGLPDRGARRCSGARAPGRAARRASPRATAAGLEAQLAAEREHLQVLHGRRRQLPGLPAPVRRVARGAGRRAPAAHRPARRGTRLRGAQPRRGRGNARRPRASRARRRLGPPTRWPRPPVPRRSPKLAPSWRARPRSASRRSGAETRCGPRSANSSRLSVTGATHACATELSRPHSPPGARTSHVIAGSSG